MYLVVVYVPVDHVDLVIEAMSAAGAGEIGGYRRCAFTTLGEGQFQPLAGANPFIGEVGQLEKVSEAKVEMVCLPEKIKAVLLALLAQHPYETPAYHVVEVKTLDHFMHD